MKDNVDKLELIARALLEKESLDQEEVKQLLGDIPKVKVL
jgi:ATP-dependent Zn protease